MSVKRVDCPEWVQPQDQAIGLLLHCQPGAKVTRVVGQHGGRLKIALHAPAVDNKANEALVAWLAECLRVPRRQIEIVSGQTSRQKKVLVEGIGMDEVIKVLNQ